ncbi:MAG: hypothetical protein AAGA42_03925 [Actinomycetota bacterium]
MTISRALCDSTGDAATTPRAADKRHSGWRRAGVGLAVGAICIGSISAWQVNASSDHQSSFVPTAPCRLFDTRAGNEPDGGKKTPLGRGEANVHTQQVTGTVGNCQIPADAVAVSMNVTAVGGTAQSNLRVFPADVDTPTASNLNWTARQSPTPNKVDVQLSPDGKISLFNQNGSVDVVANVVGYYTPNGVDALRTRVAELESLTASQAQALDDRVAEIEALSGVSDQRLFALERATPFAISASGSGDDFVDIGLDPIVVLDVDVVAPVDGRMTVNYSSATNTLYDTQFSACSVFKEPEIPSGLDLLSEAGVAVSTTPLNNNYQYIASIAGTKHIAMSAGESATLVLVCRAARENGAQVLARSMTAVFTPS